METLNKSHVDFKSIYFAAGALNLKANRVFKTVLLVKDGNVYATDGCRLHIATIENLKDGYYQVVKKTKTLILLATATCDLYPDIDCITTINYKYTIDTDILDHNEGKDTGFAYHVALINKAGFVIIPKQVNDVLQQDRFEISYNKHNQPVFFHNSNKAAYIMPMAPI